MKRTLLSVLLLGISFFAAQPALADGLYIQNDTSEVIYIAIATGKPSDLTIEGWYKLPPFKKKTHVLGSLRNNKIIYYYAYSASGRHTWGGATKLFVDPTKRFTIRRVNYRYGALPQGAQRKGFGLLVTPGRGSYTFRLY